MEIEILTIQLLLLVVLFGWFNINVTQHFLNVN